MNIVFIHASEVSFVFARILPKRYLFLPSPNLPSTLFLMAYSFFFSLLARLYLKAFSLSLSLLFSRQIRAISLAQIEQEEEC